MTNETLQLTLKEDWDYFPHYSKSQGHFVGRTEEKEKILNWFIRREKGCFLVCGERGVGKTSLVYEALREAKKQNSKIIPIIITASQLVESEFALRKEATVQEIDALKERIIVNLIRRLYADLNSKAPKELKKKLENLYKKAVCTKAEIKESLTLDEEEGSTEENKREEETKISIDPNHIKYLVSTLVAVFGVNLFYFPPFLGLYALNITIATVLITFPLSATLNIQRKIKEYIKAKKVSSMEELYISDRSLGNLTYDLQSFLETPSKVWKIIVIVDEMDKIENEKEEDVIKTFKNLFTLSNGLFVFISSNKMYDRVENAKLTRDVSYTLYNDRIFITRPSSEDLEGYIDRIIENQSKEILNDRRYRDFRNLLCYQSKSDFFELQYKIRDYIHSYNDENKPILSIEPLRIEELKQANLQKVIGQIFNLNRFEESSNWHKNNTLLNSMYCLVENPIGLKEFTRLAKTQQISLNTRIIDTCDNLLDYLSRLKYVTGKQKILEDAPNLPSHSTTHFQFRWTGAVGDIPKEPNTLFDYEKIFISQMELISRFVNEIAEQDLILDNKALEVKKEGMEMSEHSIQPLCDLDPRDTFKAKLPYLSGIKQKSPKHIPREELEKFTKEIESQILHLRNSAATIAMRLINRKLKLRKYGQSSRLEGNQSVFAGPMHPIRAGVLTNNIVHDCLFRPDYVHQILIVQDLPEELFNEQKGLINSASNHHLIINLNTKGTKYNLEFITPKGKVINGFIDVPIFESFSNLQTVFKLLKDYDLKDFKFPEVKEGDLKVSTIV